MIDMDKYTMLEINKEKGYIQIKGTKVSLPVFIEYINNGVSKTKLLSYLDLTSEQVEQAIDFIENEIGLKLKGMKL